MINVQLYNHSSSLIPYLTNFMEGSEQVTIITPNPNYADMARSKFGNVHQSVEAITIAKFLKDELIQLIPQDKLENFKGKSDLNLLLGSLWKIKKESSSYEQFKRCFQILTDFRSFTLNDDILQTILENYEEDLASGVLWFHKVLTQMDIVDEHRSYFLLSERLRAGDLPPIYQSNRTLLFWGFDFLTGSQVDLLNSLAIRNDILLPFPASAYEKSKDLDWIKWLTKFEAKIENIDEVLDSTHEVKTISFPKNYLGATLKNFKENKLSGKTLDIVLGTKNLTDDYASEIPFGGYSYKVSVDLFEDKLALLREFIFDEIRSSNKLSHSKIIDIAQAFAKESIDNQNFRAIKAATVFIETVKNWVELSEHNEQLGEFDLKIIFDSAKLDLPRNSIFSSANIDGFPIRSLKDLEKNVNADASAFCLTSSFDGIKGSVIQYSENVEKYLASIGPVRRGELEFQILKSKITEHLAKDGTYLFVEDGLVEHDLGWSNILSNFNFSQQKLESSTNIQKSYIFPKPEGQYQLESISASKLQTYIDCPRKFFLSYVLRQRPRVELTHELNFMQLGLIEHAVIEKYLQKNTTFNEEVLNEQILEVLNEFESKGELQPEKKEEYWLEVKALCSEVINELLIMNQTLGLNLFFEKELPASSQIPVNGSIDCFGENQSMSMILDFKRGGGSIPSQIGLKEFSKIQLWFYLDKLKNQNIISENKKLLWGYVNLSSLEDSLIFCDDEATIDILKGLNIKMFKKLYKFDDQMKDLVSEYQNYENLLIESINKEANFPCRPKEVKVCQYCELANICPRKEEVSNVLS